MEQYSGRTIYRSSAVGRIFYYKKKQRRIEKTSAEDVQEERVRFEQARLTAIEQMEQIYQDALRQVGEKEAAVFEIHKMMLEDQDYLDAVYSAIEEQGIRAECAVEAAGAQFEAMFAGMEDEYMQARAADVRDISQRLTAILSGESSSMETLSEPVILVAEDLAPSETIQMDKKNILAFVTKYGTTNSHTAILARTLNIPAVTGIDIQEEWDGRMAAVDGENGVVILEPDQKTIENILSKKKKEEEERLLLRELVGKKTRTRSGRRLRLYANVGSLSDIDTALEQDAEGIGLFRSEFLYLERNDFPTEEEQFQVYKSAVEKMQGKRVIIRTLDIGADKQAAYFHLGQEENPALGYRGIRICLDQPELLKTQLRAILRAGAYGRAAVMFPMIISVGEIREAKRLLEEAKKELEKRGEPFGEIETGVMVETPAAVWISEELAGEADFFSIGTNDLTQYLLAIDRQNPRLDPFYDPHHPAVLRAIQTVIENGHKGGAWVGLCGELAADRSLTKAFLDMGIDELSVAPAFLLPLRRAVCELE